MIKIKSLRYPVLILFLAFACSQGFAQGKEDFTKRLFDIKQQYTRINSTKSYRIVIIEDVQEFTGYNSDNGGRLTGYFKGDTLVKAVEWIGLSYKILQNEYYFNKGKLFFVQVKESNYHYADSTQSLDYTKTDPGFTGRYYFDNEKLFDSILSDKERNRTKEKDAKELLAAAKKYQRILKRKA